MDSEKIAFGCLSIFAAFAFWAQANLYPVPMQLVSAAAAFLFFAAAMILFWSVLLPGWQEEEIITETVYDYSDKEELPTKQIWDIFSPGDEEKPTKDC